MSTPEPNPAPAPSPDAAPAADPADAAKAGRPRGRPRVRSEDWAIIRRVLTYAAPYKRRLFAALVVGMVASVLTVVNIAALIPVLSIMLEPEGARTEHLARLDKRVADTEAVYDSTGKIEDWLELTQAEFNRAYTLWALDKKERAIYVLAALIFLGQLAKSLLEFVSKYTLAKCFYLSVLRMRTDLYQNCLLLDLGQFGKITSGDLISRLNNDARQVRQVFVTMISDGVLAPFEIIAVLGALFIMNWQLTLIVLFGGSAFVAPFYLGKKLRSMGRKDEEEDAKLLGYTQERIQGLMIVKAFGAERRELLRFKNLSRDMAGRQIKREKLRLLSDPLVEVFASLAMALVLAIGGYIILKSDNAGMSAGAFLVYLLMLTRFYPPIKKFSNTYVKLQKAMASAERIFEIIDTKPAIAEREDARTLPPFAQGVAFENATFRYAPGTEPVVADFSLAIPKGKKVALVGSTGAGKTTVVRFLPRLYDLEAGRVLVDGIDVRDVTLKSLRSQIAFVTQETILFNDTVANNIRYGRPDATMADVEAAARAAYADEFIAELPQGYETEIGERGGQLSGGQRQRLAIARALLSDTPILILDEATSALDNESEAIVQRAIERLVQNRTVIMIAHRLSTVRKADEIVVMDGGKIVERGTHDELASRNGRYRELLQAHALQEE